MSKGRTIAGLMLGLAGLVMLGACGGGANAPVGSDSAGTGAIVFQVTFPSVEDQIALYKEKYGTTPPASEMESGRALSMWVYSVYVSITASDGSFYEQIISPGSEAGFWQVPAGPCSIHCAQWDSYGYIIPQEIFTYTEVPDGGTAYLYVYFIDAWEPGDNTFSGPTDISPPDGAGANSGDHTLQRNTEGTGSDEDWFTFYISDTMVARGDVIQLRTSNLFNADTVMELYDSDGVTVLAYDDDGGGGLSSLINFVPTRADLYYARVTSFAGWDHGAYDMGVWDLPAGTPGTGDIIIVPG